MKIGLIGCGNMASVTALGIHRHNNNVDFVTYDLDPEKSQALAKELEGTSVTTLEELVGVDYLFICCKPQHFVGLSKELKALNLSHVIIVSIMASINISRIADLLKTEKIIRLMPSMPMHQDLGIALTVVSNEIDQNQRILFESLLEGCSKVVPLNDEKKYDQLTVISSSGPAFVYYLISSFERVLSDLGFEKELSSDVVSQLFLGASTMAKNSKEPIDQLISKVTSAKGITIEGINSFTENGLDQLIVKGVNQALDRSEELAKE